MKRLPAILALVACVLLTACARNTPIDPAVLASPSPAVSAAPSPDHVILPQDDAPHDDLTEWWYYTGHLDAAGGKTYGFELVVFQALRGTDPPAYAAHFAVTDNARNDFHFDQRAETGKQVHAGAGLDLNLSGWSIKGAGGNDRLVANMPDYAIDLDLTSLKPPVLHEGKGLITYGAPGWSYYYSRTRLSLSGVVTDHRQQLPVTGQAWMDHQWGNFVSSGGGWDWFSIQLDDNSELMLYFLRDSQGHPGEPYGTYVASDGTASILPPSAFSQMALGSWQSPADGISYPSGWQVKAGDATLTLTPTVKDQELRTGESTGITYWEGDVTIKGTKAGRPVSGQGYVELVGYH